MRDHDLYWTRKATIERPSSESDYQVIVGNIGTVYTGRDRAEAFRVFAIYVDQSQSEAGRAGGEDVTILQGEDLVREFEGSLARAQAAAD